MEQFLSHPLVRLTLSFVLALPIAWNRESSERSAGLRTFTLVAIGSCAFLVILGPPGQSADSRSRVLQGIITGIGFIGSGAIIKASHHVHGTATAASIFTTSAVGACCAYGMFDIAIFLSFATFAVLRWLKPSGVNSDDKSDSGSNLLNQ
ncbi:MAG: MgtC/SapB family protein [Verrucomicrobia bacterium]|nr:MgtC/SapB family protein [Verrucomicrobiota bacterium]MBV9672392.1 MgtC/SapB family protein [Verrucomicrobiota bacterium]